MGIAASKAAQQAMAAHHASSASLVIGPEQKPAEPTVVFYALGKKFVDTAKSMPDRATDIMYYTLAVGHHTGVIDCFDEALSCSLPVFERVCDLVKDEDARYKLQGILRSGEIQVDSANIATLDGPLREALQTCGGTDEPDEEAAAWIGGFLELLDRMKHDPALYLMGRKRMP